MSNPTFEDLAEAYNTTLASFAAVYPELVAALEAKGMTVEEFFFGMSFKAGAGVQARFTRDACGTKELLQLFPCSACEGCACTYALECVAQNCPCCSH